MAGSDRATPPQDEPPAPSAGSSGQSAAARIGEMLGEATAKAERVVRDPARRKQLIAAGVGLVLVVALLAALPALTRRGSTPPPAAEAPAQGEPGAAQPAPSAEQPAPAAGEASPAPPAQTSLARSYFLSALPLLLGLFWLLSAWLVDSEARRAFVVQEPWGERRTIAYTTLAVGCVFPLILAGLIFSAWGFVTFVLDVSRRQSPVAALQAASLILMAGAGFLVLRGLVAQWLERRRASR